MSSLCVKPRLRFASCLALPAILALTVSTTPAAIAQASSQFSSSSQALISADDNPSVAAAAPNPAMGRGQSDRAYGTHDRGLLSHLTFEAGGGANGPSRGSGKYITWGGNLTVGAGYRFTPHFSFLTEYQFIHDKLPAAIISPTGANGGNAHIWSFTLDPVIDFFPQRREDIYITGGGGFYRKVTNFTDPVLVEYCDYFFCGITTQNQVVGHFSSNQGGWNAGLGITHRVTGRAKVFAEARYLQIDTPAVNSQPNGLGATRVAAETKLIPVTLGVRF
jgi:opacity protein-like surface antigen